MGYAPVVLLKICAVANMDRRITVEAPVTTLGPQDKHGFVVEKILVQAGDRVQADESVAELETSKAYFEVRSPASGTVESLLVSVGDIVPCRHPLMLIRCDDGRPA